VNGRTKQRGFTLIELMIVVAIIGILSSVAIPSLQRTQLRSRAAERRLVLNSIRRAAEDVHLRDGRFPQDWGGGWSGLTCVPNPAGMPGPQKQVFSTTAVGWTNLSLVVEGNVFYRYQVSGWVGNGAGNIWAFADGDLDGDNRFSSKQMGYQLANNSWMATASWPPDGQEDDLHPDAAARTF
jgi:prepilin-type N-terminal cleavage/methylation domain-containing protein